MSSATLEAPAASEQTEQAIMDELLREEQAKAQAAEPKEEKAAEQAKMDPETEADLAEAVKLAKSAESSRTAANFKIAALVAGAIRRNVTRLAHNADDAAEYREQTIGLFSIEVSKATGLAITAKKMTEYLRAHYLSDLVGDDGKSLRKINWEVVRTLVRWTEYTPKQNEFTPRTDDAEGTYSEAWTIKAGCTERLRELVKSFAVVPKSPKAARELMDDHETEVDKAQLNALTTAARKQEIDARQTAALAARIKEVDAFFAGIVARAATLKLSMHEVGEQMRRRNIVTPMPGEFDAATISQADAARMAKEIVQANNLDAAGAMLAELMRLHHEVANNVQDSKSTGAILGSVTRQVA